MQEELEQDTIDEVLSSPEPQLDRTTTQVHYLDQKIWGQLHDGKHNTDSKFTDAYHIVKQSVDQDTAIYPFSIVHFKETNEHADPTFKRQLYEIMVDLSNNYGIRHYLTLKHDEIFAYITKHVDWLPNEAATPKVVGQGLAFAHGRYKLTYNGDQEIDQEELDLTREQIKKFTRSEYATRMLIRDQAFLEPATPDRDTDPARRDFIDNLESGRQEARELADTDEDRRKILIARSFADDVLPHIASIAQQFEVDHREIIEHDMHTATDFDDFFAQFPAFYTHLNLTLGRDFHWDRRVEINDLEDIMALAVAIPYTDTVVTEEFFGGVAYQRGLPDRYDTTVLTDLRQLADYLTEKSS